MKRLFFYKVTILLTKGQLLKYQEFKSGHVLDTIDCMLW